MHATQDPASVIEISPIKFNTKKDTILLSPEYGRWVIGGRKPNCFDPDPEACKFWKYQKFPAKVEEYDAEYVSEEASFTTTLGERYNQTYERMVLKEPANIKNSPTKLPVPGSPIFDIVKNKKIKVYKGIT